MGINGLQSAQVHNRGGQGPLTTKLKNKNVAASLDSCEGVNLDSRNTNKFKDFARNKLPFIGAMAASIGHITAGIGKYSDIIPEALTNFFDNYSLKVSKIVNVGNYLFKGIEALIHKRAWEGISRLAYPAVVPWVPLESVFTYSGISSGLTMMEQAQRHKINYSNNTQENPKGSPSSILEDLKENGKAFLSMCQETFSKEGLWGKNRKIFLSIEKEQSGGHTMFFSSWGNFIGAILGMAAGKDHSSLLGKTAAVVRNAGGIGCDWAKLLHPDISNKLSAGFYAAVSALDVTKSFTGPDISHILSHFSMALNNFANYYYVDTTNKTSDNKFVDYKPSMAN